MADYRRNVEFGIFLKEIGELMTDSDVANIGREYRLLLRRSVGSSAQALLAALASTEKRTGASTCDSEGKQFCITDPRLSGQQDLEDLFVRHQRPDLAEYCRRFAGKYGSKLGERSSVSKGCGTSTSVSDVSYDSKSPVADHVLAYVSDNIGCDWKPLVRRLGMANSRVLQIDKDHTLQHSVREKTMRALQEMCSNCGTCSVTVADLDKALRTEGKTIVAEGVRRIIQERSATWKHRLKCLDIGTDCQSLHCTTVSAIYWPAEK